MSAKETNRALAKKLAEVRLEPVHPDSVEAANATRVTIEGQENDLDLAQLLEDAAKFIRASENAPEAKAFEHKEMIFKRLDVNDFVLMAHRS